MEKYSGAKKHNSEKTLKFRNQTNSNSTLLMSPFVSSRSRIPVVCHGTQVPDFPKGSPCSVGGWCTVTPCEAE
eukprot:147411-Amphidinium_carterae.1